MDASTIQGTGSMATQAYDASSLVDKSIFELLGLNGISDQKKDAMMQEMLAIVDNRVLARIADKLGDEELAGFEASMDGSEESVTAYLAHHGIDMAALYAQETVFYKHELLEMVGGRLNPSTTLATA